MRKEEARLYLEHTSKEDFKLEEWQKENRYQAIQVVLKEIERLNNIISELEKWLDKKEKLTFNSWNKGIHEVQRKLQELKGDDKE